MEIRSLTIPYSKYKAKQSRNVETAIQKRLDEIDTLITNSNGLQNIDPELKEYDRLKRDLQAIYDTRGKGAIFRSKVRWTEEGEKPTKYFFNIEKRNFNTKVIAELKPDPDGNVIVDEKEIMCEIHSYYADLYKSEVDSDKSDDSQFADDTSLLCKDLNSVENAIALLNVFERVSGLKLNQSKTKALWLGPWRFSDSKPLGLKWTKDPVRTLGIFISYDEKGNYKKNITEKIEKMDNRLNFCRSRSLTLLGRCLIFKSLGVPQLIYSASMSSMPIEASVKLITNYLFNFIWNKKPDKIKRQVMYQDYMDGGLYQIF